MDDIGGVLHDGGGTLDHTILIIGWSSSEWHIKDSWPGDAYIDYKSFNVFSATYNSEFWRAKYDYNGSDISCTGSDCSLFSSRSCVDEDEDGFYNWGIGDKPTGYSGTPCQMDFNDADSTIIFLDANYNELPAPYITGPDLICGYDSFTFHGLPDDFEIEWDITPTQYFYSPYSGDDDTVAYASPRPEYIGKTCTVTFTISDDCGEAEYSKDFIINGPKEELVTIEVEDSYGNPPPQYSGVWLLCPNTNYYIFIENDSDCDIYDYEWIKPAGWSQYYAYQNYISINSGSNPTGTLQVKACTCCEGDNCNTNDKVVVKTQYFSQSYNCGGYFMAYPNPVNSELIISFTDKLDLKEPGKSLEIYSSDYKLKYKLKDFTKEKTISVNDWKEGFYYIRLKYKKEYEDVKIQIKH
ncbi:MAG: T9SS type A sorting domain-containing protein [Mariniphaga sp.]|nr:T9SS type A sorting domain-containing protein [Mariniphaga sp.]